MSAPDRKAMARHLIEQGEDFLARFLSNLDEDTEALRARVAALEAALLHYGTHDAVCEYWEVDNLKDSDCTCGYTAAALSAQDQPADAGRG